MFEMNMRSIILSIVFVLLMVSIITPLSILTISFIMIPLVMMFTTLQVRSFVVHFAISLGLIILLTGLSGIYLVVTAILMLGPAIVMGHLFKQGRTAPIVIVSTFISILIVVLFVFLVYAAAGINLVDEMTNLMKESFFVLQNMMVQPLSEERMEYTIYVLTQIIPLYILVFAAYYTVVTYWISRRLLNRMGLSIQGLRPIKEWMVPKAIVWYYVIALILSLVVQPEPYSMLSQILVNIIPLLTIIFCIQAISFLFYLTDVKKWNRAIPAIGIIGCIFLPTYMSLLGVFDVLFQIRKNVDKP